VCVCVVCVWVCVLCVCVCGVCVLLPTVSHRKTICVQQTNQTADDAVPWHNILSNRGEDTLQTT